MQKINDLLNVGSDEATEQAQTISSALLAYLKDDVVFSALLEVYRNLNVTPVDGIPRLLQRCRGCPAENSTVSSELYSIAGGVNGSAYCHSAESGVRRGCVHVGGIDIPAPR